MRLLKSLHWHPIQYRVIFKICTVNHYFNLSNKYIYVNCSILQERQLRSSSSVYFLFLELNQSELWLSRLPHQHFGVHSSLSVRSAANIMKYCRHLNTYSFGVWLSEDVGKIEMFILCCMLLLSSSVIVIYRFLLQPALFSR